MECRKHAAAKWLQSVPLLGTVRMAVLIGRVQTPHRFRTKRQFWSYCGLALETHDSADYRVVHGQVQRGPGQRGPRFEPEPQPRTERPVQERCHDGRRREGVFREFYSGLLAKGMRPEMARLTLARKIAAITLHVWKKGETFNAEYLKPQAA